MAVGDFVNGIFVTAGTSTFQPASGVTIMLTHAMSYNVLPVLTNGTSFADVIINNNSGPSPSLKLFINNTLFLSMGPSGNNGKSYCGVQVA